MEQREAKMAGLTGLFQRGSSYYPQVVLPLNHPLQKTYKNGKFVQSLGRCTYRDAIRDGTIKRAQVLYGAVQKPVVRHSLQDIHGKWKPSKARSDDTVNACLRAVRLYEEFTNNLPVEDLTRELGGAFRTWLEHPDSGHRSVHHPALAQALPKVYGAPKAFAVATALQACA